MTPIEQHNQQPNLSSFQQFNKIAISNTPINQQNEFSHYPPEPKNKINYSRMVEEFKKHNPEED